MKNGRLAEKIRKLIWHVRWAILICTFLFSVAAIFLTMELQFFLTVHGIVWPLYFFLHQWEGYFECKANCKY